MTQNLSLLVVTSKANSWAVPCFFRQLKKHYPEFRGNVYINLPKDGTPEVTAGIPEKFRDFDWSTRTLKAVQQIETEYILLCLEDNDLLGNVDPSLINSALATLEKDPKIGSIDFDVDFHYQPRANEIYYKGSPLPYAAESTPHPMLCASLIRTSYFRRLLRKGEDPWTYESFAYWRARFLHKKVLVYADAKKRPLWPAPFGGVIHGGRILDEYRPLFTETELGEADKPKPRPESYFLRLPGSIPVKKILYWFCRKLSLFHFSRSKIIK